jgi:hypothetical protein
VSDWTAEEREYLRVEVPRRGLRTPFRGGTVQSVAKQARRGRPRAAGGAGGFVCCPRLAGCSSSNAFCTHGFDPPSMVPSLLLLRPTLRKLLALGLLLLLRSMLLLSRGSA